MGLKLDRRESGWFLDDERLPGIEPKETHQFRKYGYWADKTLGDLLQDAARQWPGHVALAQADRRVSYAELDFLSSRLALGFLNLGFGSGDVIAVQLPNSVEHAVTVFAIAKIGAICSIVVPLMREKEVTYILKHCRPKAIVIPTEYAGFNYLAMVEQIAPAAPSLETVVVVGDVRPRSGLVRYQDLVSDTSKNDADADQLRAHRPHPDDISLIGFTSGTTAMPKAYIHTHNTEYANGINCLLANSYRFARKPTVNIALPGFAWMYGRWCNLLSGLMEGVTNVIVDPLKPDAVIDTIVREKPTHIHGAPAIYRMLMDGIDELRASGRCSIEAFHYAGSVMPYEMARRLRNAAQLLTCYGLSEISPVCGNSIMDSPESQIRSSGRPAWGNQVVLLDADQKRVAVGEEGQVAVRGPGLTLGYLRQSEANGQAFIEDGLFLTGDVGFFDDMNCLNITDRIKDVIDRGGVKFSPREVEELLLEHPSIANAALVGMPDPKLGERNCAFVVIKPDASANLDELIIYLRSKGLATHKLPERLETIQALPITATGKVQKFLLRQIVSEKLRSQAPS